VTFFFPPDIVGCPVLFCIVYPAALPALSPIDLDRFSQLFYAVNCIHGAPAVSFYGKAYTMCAKIDDFIIAFKEGMEFF